MNEILTVEQLRELSDEELKDLHKQYTARALIQKNIEQAIKILINSLYGYLGSPYSRFYNMYIAEAITLTGQALIRTSANLVNDDLTKIIGFERDRIPAIDTDSTLFGTILLINNKKIKIGDYYNMISNDNLVDHKKEIKKVTNGDVSLSFNGQNVENKKIKYVMRHKVKKNHYKITIGNDSVVVTEDHSVIVIDENNSMITIKPAEMNPLKHSVVRIVEND